MITLDVKEVLIYLVLIALLVFIVYLILVAKKLIVTLQKTDKVLDDGGVVTEIAANRATDIDGIIDNVSGVVSTVAEEANGNQGLIKTATDLGKAATSTLNFVKDQREKKEEKEYEEYKKEKKAKEKAAKKEAKQAKKEKKADK